MCFKYGDTQVRNLFTYVVVKYYASQQLSESIFVPYPFHILYNVYVIKIDSVFYQ